jgi:WD40 repeat protein
MRRLKGHRGNVECLAFHPNGLLLATGDNGGMVRIWSVLDGKCLHKTRLEEMLGAVAFSPQGDHFAAGTYDGQVALYRFEAQTNCLELLDQWAYQGRITSLAFSPNGKWLTWLSYSILRRVEVGRLHDTRHLNPTGDGFCIRYTPDGSQLVRVGLGPRLLLNDPETLKARGRITHGDENGCWSVAFGPNGEIMVLGLGGGVQVWNFPQRRLLKAFLDHKKTVSTVALSADASRLITAGYDNRVNVYEFTPSGSITRLMASYYWRVGRLFEVALCPDGTLAACAAARGVVLWDVE